MTVRPLKPKDRTSWQVMWEGYSAFYGVDASATTDNTWQRLLQPTAEGPYGLVYEDDNGALLGLTHYLFHAQTRLPVPKCYLNDLFTLPEARGTGVGRHLIEAVYHKAAEKGCDQVYWLTQEFNTAGRRLYDKVATQTAFIKYQHQVGSGGV